MPSLGRLPNPPDARDLLHPMTAVLDQIDTTTLPASRSWRGPALRVNQGNHGYCVGYAGSNWEGAAPIMDAITNQTGTDLYMACKAIPGEPWPGQEGTSDRYLMQVLKNQGRVARYLWAQKPDDIKNWILGQGGVLVGTNWYERMFDPETSIGHGGLWLRPGGNIAGGHEWLIRRYYAPWDAYRMRNSWGPNWAMNGEAWIAASDLYRLVFSESGGDACAAIEKRP